MLPIDYHVQNALHKFNREMRRLNQGRQVAEQDLKYQHIESDTNKNPVNQIRYTSSKSKILSHEIRRQKNCSSTTRLDNPQCVCQ